MFHWSFLLVLLGTVAQQSSAINLRTMCRGHPYGTLLPNPRDCNSYYTCESVAELAYCDHGLHFDRVHKVCNWPNWANCIIEDIEDEHEITSEVVDEDLLEKEKPKEEEEGKSEEKTLEHSMEASEHQSVEEHASEETSKLDSSLDSSESSKEDIVEPPNHIQLSKEPSSIDEENELMNSHGIVSSISKNLTSNELAEVPSDSASDSKPVQNPILAIEIPVAVGHANVTSIEVPITTVPNNNRPPQNATHVVQVAVAVPVVDVISEGEVAVEKVESSIPLENSNQVIELTVPESPSSAVDAIPEGEVAVEKVESSIPLENSNQVIELTVPESPVEVPNSVVDAISQGEVAVEKVESSKPLENTNQVIELTVPESPMEVPNSVVDAIPQDEVAVEKVESSKPVENSNQVIELTVLESQMEVPSSALDAIPQGEILVEKVDPMKPPENLNQVIELVVPAYPSSSEVQVEKVDSPSIQNPIQVVERPNFSIDMENIKKGDSSSQSLESSDEESNSKSIESSEVAHATIEESAENKVNSSEEDLASSQSSEEDSKHNSADSFQSFEENVMKPNHHHHPHHSHQHNSVGIVKIPTKSKEIIEGSSEGVLHLQTPSRPDKLNVQSSKDPNNVEELAVPLGQPIASQNELNSVNQNSNLTVSILSVGSSNDSINRPIVGAHSIETGHPVSALSGYNSRNVQCIHNGLYFLPHPSSCQKYFICAYHHLHLHSCGTDLVWSYKRKQCELQSNSRCYSNEIPRDANPEPEQPTNPSEENTSEEIAPTPTTTTTSPTPMPPLRTTLSTLATVKEDNKLPICPPTGQIYLPNVDDCNKYYICILGTPVLTSCPDNLHWDTRGKFCGQPTLVQCADG